MNQSSEGVEQVAGTMVLGFCIQYIAVGEDLSMNFFMFIESAATKSTSIKSTSAFCKVRGSSSSVRAMALLTRPAPI